MLVAADENQAHDDSVPWAVAADLARARHDLQRDLLSLRGTIRYRARLRADPSSRRACRRAQCFPHPPSPLVRGENWEVADGGGSTDGGGE
eukprot:6184637-Pleurochrysis_carterae.AAC.8